MAQRYPSRVFEAGEKLYDRLLSISFPNHPVTDDAIKISFGDEDPDLGAEQIIIVANPDEAFTEWVRASPAGRDETIVFDVIHRSATIEMDTDDEPSQLIKWRWLSTVSDLIETAVFNRATNKVNPLGFDGETPIGRVAGVRPEITNTNQGAVGVNTVTVELRADI